MKKSYITILLFFITVTSYSQNSTDRDEYNVIFDTTINTDTVALKKKYTDFIKKYPNSIYKYVTMFELANLYIDNRPDSALIFLNQILPVSIPDSLINSNYQNDIAKEIARMYIKKKQYKKALKYVDLAKNKYTNKYSCGSGQISNDIDLNSLYSKCYIGLKKYQQAIQIIAPYMFPDPISRTNVAIEVYDAYLKLYSKQQIRAEFLNTDKTLIIKSGLNQTDSSFITTIKIFGQEIYTPFNFSIGYLIDVEKPNPDRIKEIIIQDIKRSDIYKLAIAE